MGGVEDEVGQLSKILSASGRVSLCRAVCRFSVLCDSNADLIDLYAELKADPKEFIRVCKQLFAPENNKAGRFYELRTEFNKSKRGTRRASLFLYLNRHCYNGLCRYNRRGQFNTPFGRYDRPYFPENEMMAFAERLQTAEIK
jgi:DNA adenine methylase